MALIKASYLDELKEHAAGDIVSLIGAETPLKKAGKDHVGLCTFHEEKTPSLHVDHEKGCYNCFGCGAGGDALKFVVEYYGLPFQDAVKRLAKLTNFKPVEYEKPDSPAPKVNTGYAKTALAKAANMYTGEISNQSAAVAYMRSRGITADDVKNFHLGVAPDSWDYIPKALIKEVGVKALKTAGLVGHKEGSNRVWDFFRNRLMFPVRNTSGDVIAFGGRTLISNAAEGKKAGKYINTPDTPLFTKGQHLYGLYESIQKPSPEKGTMNVVEGYLDVIASHRHGLSNTVAPMGTAVTTDQFKKIFRYSDHARFIFDGDASGYKAAYSAVKASLPLLDGHKQVSITLLPDGEDPDTLLKDKGSTATYKAMLDQSIPASQFLIDYLSAQNPGGSIENKTKIVNEVRELSKLITDENFKTLLINEIESSLNISLSNNTKPETAKKATPSELLEKLDEHETIIVQDANPCLVKYCGMVINNPEWLEIYPLPDVQPEDISPNGELIQFTEYTVEQATQRGVKPESVYESELRFLVDYLSNTASHKVSKQILDAKQYSEISEELVKKKAHFLTQEY